MTVTTPIGLPVPAPIIPPGSIRFPLAWLLERAAAPLQYRASTEVAQLPVAGGGGGRLRALAYGHAPAISLALRQSPDGLWNGAMLAPPPARGDPFHGVGTIPAVRRLLEYGWDPDSPPIARARRTIFRLLAEDEDPAYAFELAPSARGDVEGVRRARVTLREAGAAVLAQAGFERDPRVRGAATRIMHRLDRFLASPLAQDPFVRVGNQRALAPDTAPPSHYTLLMLAYMPLFRRKWAETMEALGKYLAQPAPRTAPAIATGRELVPAPHLVLGDPLPGESAMEADFGPALAWLELVARLGFLRPGTTWGNLFERRVDDCDVDGIWRPRKGAPAPRTTNAFGWPSWTLEAQHVGDARFTDVTFRLGLIGKLAGWQIELA